MRIAEDKVYSYKSENASRQFAKLINIEGDILEGVGI